MKSNLKKFRTEAGLSQEALAELAGIAISQISKLENKPDANPTMRTAIFIAAALNVSVFDIWEIE